MIIPRLLFKGDPQEAVKYVGLAKKLARQAFEAGLINEVYRVADGVTITVENALKAKICKVWIEATAVQSKHALIAYPKDVAAEYGYTQSGDPLEDVPLPTQAAVTDLYATVLYPPYASKDFKYKIRQPAYLGNQRVLVCRARTTGPVNEALQVLDVYTWNGSMGGDLLELSHYYGGVNYPIKRVATNPDWVYDSISLSCYTVTKNGELLFNLALVPGFPRLGYPEEGEDGPLIVLNGMGVITPRLIKPSYPEITEPIYWFVILVRGDEEGPYLNYNQLYGVVNNVAYPLTILNYGGGEFLSHHWRFNNTGTKLATLNVRLDAETSPIQEGCYILVEREITSLAFTWNEGVINGIAVTLSDPEITEYYSSYEHEDYTSVSNLDSEHIVTTTWSGTRPIALNWGWERNSSYPVERLTLAFLESTYENTVTDSTTITQETTSEPNQYYVEHGTSLTEGWASQHRIDLHLTEDKVNKLEYVYFSDKTMAEQKYRVKITEWTDVCIPTIAGNYRIEDKTEYYTNWHTVVYGPSNYIIELHLTSNYDDDYTVSEGKGVYYTVLPCYIDCGSYSFFGLLDEETGQGRADFGETISRERLHRYGQYDWPRTWVSPGLWIIIGDGCTGVEHYDYTDTDQAIHILDRTGYDWIKGVESKPYTLSIYNQNETITNSSFIKTYTTIYESNQFKTYDENNVYVGLRHYYYPSFTIISETDPVVTTTTISTAKALYDTGISTDHKMPYPQNTVKRVVGYHFLNQRDANKYFYALSDYADYYYLDGATETATNLTQKESGGTVIDPVEISDIHDDPMTFYPLGIK